MSVTGVLFSEDPLQLQFIDRDNLEREGATKKVFLTATLDKDHFLKYFRENYDQDFQCEVKEWKHYRCNLRVMPSSSKRGDIMFNSEVHEPLERQFVVFMAADKFWYSIDIDSAYITIQKSRTEAGVTDLINDQERMWICKLKTGTGGARLTVMRFFELLQENNDLEKPYDFFGNRIEEFTRRLSGYSLCGPQDGLSQRYGQESVSSTGLFGEQWKEQLQFVDRDDYENKQEETFYTKILGNNDLLEFFRENYSGHVHKDIVEWKWWRSELTMPHKIEHHIVIFKASDGYWYSIEKGLENVTLQKSAKEEGVKELPNHAKRNAMEELSKRKSKPEKQVLDVLVSLQKLVKKEHAYHLLKDNCQHFAERILGEFSA